MKHVWLRKTLKWLDLPEDLDPNVPRITTLGRDSMLVENLKSLRRCTQGEVLLLTGAGTLLVKGENLQVKELGQSRALIMGDLQAWGFEV